MDKKNYLDDCLATLQIPSLPKKTWDKVSEFNKGVCLVRRIDGTENYAICRYNKEKDEAVKVVKDFCLATFTEILECYPVPDFVEADIESMDLDEANKMAMEELLEERQEAIMEDVKVEEEKLPEWIYPFISNREEALAFLKSKRIRNAHSLKSDEAVKAKLYLVYEDEKKKNK